jgi:transcriptional regulator with XRE-family HTH domain
MGRTAHGADTPDPLMALAGELRWLRGECRMSLRELERVTFSSDSALSRYLSGQTVPPWPVVEALCRTAGSDPERLRGLWTAARAARAGNRGRAGAAIAVAVVMAVE